MEKFTSFCRIQALRASLLTVAYRDCPEKFTASFDSSAWISKPYIYFEKKCSMIFVFYSYNVFQREARSYPIRRGEYLEKNLQTLTQRARVAGGSRINFSRLKTQRFLNRDSENSYISIYFSRSPSPLSSPSFSLLIFNLSRI